MCRWPITPLSSSGCVLATILISMAATPAAAQNSEVSDDAQISNTANPPADDQGEIIVTARLRAETLTMVPVAVNALSAADLSRYATTNLTSLATQVPSLVIN